MRSHQGVFKEMRPGITQRRGVGIGHQQQLGLLSVRSQLENPRADVYDGFICCIINHIFRLLDKSYSQRHHFNAPKLEDFSCSTARPDTRATTDAARVTKLSPRNRILSLKIPWRVLTTYICRRTDVLGLG